MRSLFSIRFGGRPRRARAAAGFLSSTALALVVAGVASGRADAQQARRLCPRLSVPAPAISCDAWVRHSARASVADSGPPSGALSPANFHTAYNLPTKARHPQTVAVVIPNNDPTIDHDLAVFSRHYHLPLCTTKTGCLRVVNEAGHKSPLPATDGDEAGEAALSLETIHGICQNCHLLLVEANEPVDTDLDAAIDTAAKLGAMEIAVSFIEIDSFNRPYAAPHYRHPGVVIVAAGGDQGYQGEGTSFPASLPTVISAGGTSLTVSSRGRYVRESAWNNADGSTGSGCSAVFAAPAWQRSFAKAAGCQPGQRAENDVAAEADPETGAGIYTSTPIPSQSNAKGWFAVGGTSLSSPIIAAVFALAGGTPKNQAPGATLYAQRRYLRDITRGSNGSCSSKPICKAARGYDGPTGLGTPNGLKAFTAPTRHR